jgi:DNA processing protein
VADSSGRSRDDLAAHLALAQIPGIGAARLRTLIAAFESARAASQAPHGAIAALPGMSRAAATAIRGVTLQSGQEILDTLERLGATVLLAGEHGFPPLLEEIPDPPAFLYAWGDLTLLARPAVGIVGSRNHSAYGAAATRLLAAGVARRAVVVSGMARGLDALAHAAALDAGGGTIGVLGNGFGVVYPAANRELYERMIARGCLITELAPGERPHAGAFPRRNRLISGLGGATVIVEAAPGSGALITADCALDQGRTVLAVPGPITSPTSLGCNRLIQQGAGQSEGANPPAAPPPPDLTELQRALWDALQQESRHVDALVAAVGAGVGAVTADVLTALTELELRGVVRQKPGMVFGLA